jgi:hypothetical protein
LADEFVGLLSFKPPSSFKVASNAQAAAADHAYVVETLDRLERSFNKFLRQRQLRLTTPERTYFELLAYLARLTRDAMAANRTQPASELIPRLVAGVNGCLTMHHATAFALPADQEEEHRLLMLAAWHGLSYLRDAATAVRLAAGHVVSFNDRERERDRSGQSLLQKEVLAQVAALDAAAKKELELGKARVQLLATEVTKREFKGQVVRWTLGSPGSEDDMSKALREEVGEEAGEWATLLADSWKQNVKGWEQVKWL